MPFWYESMYLLRYFFNDISKVETMVYDSIRPEFKAGDTTVYDLKAIHYNQNGTI